MPGSPALYAYRRGAFALAVYRDRIEIDDPLGLTPQHHVYRVADVAAVRSTPCGQLFLDLSDGRDVAYALETAAAEVRDIVATLL